MKILFDIGHPAHIHIFKNMIKLLHHNNIESIITCRQKDIAEELLKIYKLDYIIASKQRKGFLGQIFEVFEHSINILIQCIIHRPRFIITSGGLFCILSSLLLNIKLISFIDTESIKFFIALDKPFLYKVFTPHSYRLKLGKKHITYPGYQQNTYLLPDYFKPSKSIYRYLQINESELFVILRFSALRATHDSDYRQITDNEKILLVHELTKFSRVFITSESSIPKEIEQYLIKIPYDKMHDALYFASLFIGESGAMTSESALLGTPAIFICSETAGTHEFSIKNKLVHRINNKESNYISKIVELSKSLLTNPKLKDEMNKNRINMIREFIDLNRYIVDLIIREDIKKLTNNDIINLQNNYKIKNYLYEEID